MNYFIYYREEVSTVTNNGDDQDDKEESTMKRRSPNPHRPPSPIMIRRQSVFEDISQGIPRVMTRLNFL